MIFDIGRRFPELQRLFSIRFNIMCYFGGDLIILIKIMIP